MELIDIANALGWSEYLLIVTGIAAILAAFAPPVTEASPTWWKHCRAMLDLLAGNFKNARNRR